MNDDCETTPAAEASADAPPHHPDVDSAPKILFVIDTLEVGGTEQSLLQLVTRLAADGYGCTVCSLYRGDTLAEAMRQAGARVVNLGLERRYRFPAGVRRLGRLIRDEQPDLVHTMLFRASQVGRIAAHFHGKPVISSFVNVPYDASRRLNDPSVKPWKLRWIQRMDTATARWVTHFHAVSETAKAFDCRDLRVTDDRVTVVPRGRDTSRYAVSRHDACREPSGPSILNVGRLIAQKGQSDLLEAIEIVHRQHPDLHLNIAGDGPLSEPLQQQISARGLTDSVSLLGRRSDIPDLLAQTDLFAFPSHYEGLPGALIEAMLAGCPIVASDIPQNTELIDHERSGLLVPAGNPVELAKALVRLINDSAFARALGDQARETALSRYDIEQVNEQMKDLYRRVLDRSAGATAASKESTGGVDGE